MASPEDDDPLPSPMTILSAGPTSSNLFFIDLETVGLDCTRDKILEIAVAVVDAHLTCVIDTFQCVLHYERAELEKILSPWSREHFSDDFLREVESSTLTLVQAGDMLADFLDKYRNGKKAILAGSSVAFDRICLQYQLPHVVEYRVHYRTVDVSTVAELMKRWNYEAYVSVPCRPDVHRAMDDVMASYRVLKHYKDCGFVTKE